MPRRTSRTSNPVAGLVRMEATGVAYDAIVIGGGVSGLAAACELARHHRRVLLLEARSRLGGRIDTRHPEGWPGPVELGAEFVHVGNGDLWQLMRRAGIRTRRLADRHWLAGPEGIRIISDLDQRLGKITAKIRPASAGAQSFGAYFRKHPPDVTREDWMLARSFVEGFEAAPLNQISARSLAGETMDEQHQYAVPGGYGQVVTALVAECLARGVEMHTDAVVRAVRWRRGRVAVSVRRQGRRGLETHLAPAAVVTLPLGVLQARAVRFSPALKRLQADIDRMGMGHVVRIAFRFRAAMWRRISQKISRHPLRGGWGFVHSHVTGMPVWWSLSDAPVLVGWAGGPAALALLKLPAAARRTRALRSLGEILGIAPATLRQGVLDWQGHDWTHDPFSRGAYSFTAAGEDETAAHLRRPVQDTIFFAGEATADGAEVGTVHGALGSGIRAAKQAARAPRS